MKGIEISAFQLARKFMGIKEVSGVASNPQILAMLRLDNAWPEGDEVPWCSAFVNYICHLLGLIRSHNLAARSWLTVGVPIGMLMAEAGFDVVILKRGVGEQPGAEVIAAPGHVGFYAGRDQATVEVLAGNQGNAVSFETFPFDRVLGVRRLL